MQRQALVVDDSRVARLTLSKLLAPYNLDIVQIASGEEALSYLRSSSVKPDIIFMDVTMSGLDGLETTKIIKENEALSAIPVVMCTGHDTAEDKSQAIGVGAIAALTKPPNEGELARLMTHIENNADAENEIVEEIIEEIPVQKPVAEAPVIAMSIIEESAVEASKEDEPLVEEILMVPNTDELRIQLEHDWLPRIQQIIDTRVEDVTRRIAAETVSGVLLNQQKLAPKPQIDSAEIEAKIAINLEQELMPKVQQEIADTAEEVSRRIVLDLLDSSISSHMKVVLPSIKEQLKEQVKQSTIEVAQQAAQQMIDQSAETAVQYAIDDSGLTEKISETLDQQGSTWLTKQEQHMSLVASQQVEQNISPLISQYLDVNLAEKLAQQLAKQDTEEKRAKEEKLEKDVNELTILVSEMTKKVSVLNYVVIALWVGLMATVAMTFLF